MRAPERARVHGEATLPRRAPSTYSRQAQLPKASTTISSRAGAVLAGSLALLGASPPAAAQSPSAVAVTQSREAFRAGLRAADHGDWPRALGAFEQAYALVPRPLTLLNLAGAQVRVGRPVAGAESYRRFLREATAAPAARYRDVAARALREAEALVAHVRVAASGMQPDDALVLDGQPLPLASATAAIPLDPQAHALELVRAGRRVGGASFVLRAGETATIELRAAQPPPSTGRAAATGNLATTAALGGPLGRAGARAHGRAHAPWRVAGTAPQGRTRAPDHAVWRSPWLWGAAGLLFAAAGATALALALRAPPEAGAYPGTLAPSTLLVPE